MKKVHFVITCVLVASLLGCKQTGLTKTQMGTGGGALFGALGGKIFGKGKNEALYIAGGALAGGWIGHKIGQYLDEQDKQKLAQSSHDAIETGETQTWSNPETKNSGQVAVVDDRQEEANVKVRVLKDRVEEVPPLDMVGQRYSLTSNANLRGGPSNNYKVLTTLKKGVVVDAIGKVQGKSWMMVGQNQVGNGFIHSSLMAPAPEDAALTDTAQQETPAGEIAEESVVVNRTCRTVRQTVTLADGTVQEEEITACKGPNGWETI